QVLVRRFGTRQRLIGHKAMPVVLDKGEPSLRPPFSHCRHPDTTTHVESAMGAGTNAGIFATAPIHQIVPALAAGSGMVGDFVSRQACGLASLLGDVVEIAGVIGVRNGQLAGCSESRKGSP